MVDIETKRLNASYVKNPKKIIVSSVSFPYLNPIIFQDGFQLNQYIFILQFQTVNLQVLFWVICHAHGHK